MNKNRPKKITSEVVQMDLVLAFLVFVICLMLACYLPTAAELRVPPPVVQV